jgi:hypothetical protein
MVSINHRSGQSLHSVSISHTPLFSLILSELVQATHVAVFAGKTYLNLSGFLKRSEKKIFTSRVKIIPLCIRCILCERVLIDSLINAFRFDSAVLSKREKR